jgi:hypothetical protein
MPTLSEHERVDRAVTEAINLVAEGDQPTVAVEYVAEQHDLDHWIDVIHQRVLKEGDDAE